ncbi:MAG: hypothetical protein AAF928_01745, partial [Myxococcota bacterium]
MRVRRQAPWWAALALATSCQVVSGLSSIESDSVSSAATGGAGGDTSAGGEPVSLATAGGADTSVSSGMGGGVTCTIDDECDEGFCFLDDDADGSCFDCGTSTAGPTADPCDDGAECPPG